MSTRIELKALDRGWYSLDDPMMDLILDPWQLLVNDQAPPKEVASVLWRPDAKFYADGPDAIKRFVCWLALYEDELPQPEYYVGFRLEWNGKDWGIGYHSPIDVILREIQNLPKVAKNVAEDKEA